MSEKSNRINSGQEPKKKDCKYGIVAIEAANLAANGKMNPKDAWEKACDVVWPDKTKNKSCREKPCPKNTFLGLCEDGMIKDIDKGEYYRAKADKLNKKYAIKAVKILRENPELLFGLRF